MSGNLPFGFSGDPGDQNNPNQGPGGFDMSQLGAMLQQLGAMLQSGGNEVSGPVDWDLAHNLPGSPSARRATRRSMTTTFGASAKRSTSHRCGWTPRRCSPPVAQRPRPRWSRSEWLEATWPAWQQIIEPIAEGVQQTLTTMPDMGQINLEDLGIPGLRENMPAGMPDLNELAGPLGEHGQANGRGHVRGTGGQRARDTGRRRPRRK